MKKEKKKIIYRDIECDSDEEKYFLMWAFELKEAGYISKIERAPSFKLTDGWVNEYEEQLKTKTKPKKQTILQDSEYTPDILLTFSMNKWDKLVWLKSKAKVAPCKMDKLFIGTDSNQIESQLHLNMTSSQCPSIQVVAEIKSEYNMQNMLRVFGLNQKFVYNKYGIYVNLVKIPKFFEQTFVPKEYLKTDISGKDRKINFKYVLIEEYLKNLEKQ